MHKIMPFINIIKITVLLSFVYGLLKLNKRHKTHLILLVILSLNLTTEIASSVLQFYALPVGTIVTISVFMHNTLWLYLIARLSKSSYGLVYVNVLFSILNFIFFEGFYNFNSYTFLLGAIAYLTLFVFISSQKLRKEELQFFKSNSFILLSAPILFFFGFSLIFGFNERKIADFLLFSNISLYTFISYFVNIIYYSLINIYIYKESKEKNVL